MKEDSTNIKKIVLELEKIKKITAGKDLKELEDSYFSKFDCFDDISKITLESKYIKSKLIGNKEEYESVPDFEYDLRILDYIIENHKNATPKSIPIYKHCLMLFELRFGMRITFFTEIDNLIDDLENRNDKNKRKGL